ncbi:MAG: hypothetical protein ACM339_14440 [Ignavibacteria bacterium]
METKININNHFFRKDLKNKRSSLLLPNKSDSRNIALIKTKIKQKFYDGNGIILLVSNAILKDLKKQ